MEPPPPPVGDPTNPLNHHDEENPLVFFDISIGSEEIGRIILELFSDVCPRTSENFRQFCTGEYRKEEKPVGYKDVLFHRIVKGFMIQGGDFVNGNGTGCTSIYGEKAFEDESLGAFRHTGPGILAMANSGPNTNGNQFYITCAACPFLDGKYVIFGKVASDDSMNAVRRLEKVAVNGSNRPIVDCKVTQCGEL